MPREPDQQREAKENAAYTASTIQAAMRLPVPWEALNAVWRAQRPRSRQAGSVSAYCSACLPRKAEVRLRICMSTIQWQRAGVSPDDQFDLVGPQPSCSWLAGTRGAAPGWYMGKFGIGVVSPNRRNLSSQAIQPSSRAIGTAWLGCSRHCCTGGDVGSTLSSKSVKSIACLGDGPCNRSTNRPQSHILTKFALARLWAG